MKNLLTEDLSTYKATYMQEHVFAIKSVSAETHQYVLIPQLDMILAVVAISFDDIL